MCFLVGFFQDCLLKWFSRLHFFYKYKLPNICQSVTLRTLYTELTNVALKTSISCSLPNFCHPRKYTDDCLTLCATRQELYFTSLKFFYLLILERGEGERERDRNINLLFHLFMNSLVAPCMCPDWGWNPQPWHMGLMFQPTEQHSQGYISHLNEKILSLKLNLVH